MCPDIVDAVQGIPLNLSGSAKKRGQWNSTCFLAFVENF